MVGEFTVIPYLAMVIEAGREQRRRKATVVRNILRMQDECETSCPQCRAQIPLRPFTVTDVEFFYAYAGRESWEDLIRTMESRWNANNKVACPNGCMSWRVRPVMGRCGGDA